MGKRLDAVKIAAMNNREAEDMLSVAEGINRRQNSKASWKPMIGLAGGGLLGAGIGGAFGGTDGGLLGAGIGATGGLLAGAIMSGNEIEKSRKAELARRFPKIDSDLIDDATNTNLRSSSLGAGLGAGTGYLLGSLANRGPGDIIPTLGAVGGGLAGYFAGKHIGGVSDKEKAIRMLTSHK